MTEIINRTREEVLKRWVEALESGKYSQATGQLRYTNHLDSIAGYCCLGVLCKLAEDDGGQKFSEYDVYGVDSCTEFPPKELMEFVFDVEFCESLAELNDNSHTFKEIAGVIRAKMAEEGIK